MDKLIAFDHELVRKRMKKREHILHNLIHLTNADKYLLSELIKSKMKDKEKKKKVYLTLELLCFDWTYIYK